MDHVRSLTLSCLPETADPELKLELQRDPAAADDRAPATSPSASKSLQSWLDRALIYCQPPDISVALS